MTIQTVIDTIATQLAKQRRRSVMMYTDQTGYTNSKCGYRGDNGSMCAVGCLIPDELYTRDLERYGTVFNVLNQSVAESGWSPIFRDHLYGLMPELEHHVVYSILNSFQNWHDRESFLGNPYSGVTTSYLETLNDNVEVTEEELKVLIADQLTTIANWWLQAEQPLFTLEKA